MQGMTVWREEHQPDAGDAGPKPALLAFLMLQGASEVLGRNLSYVLVDLRHMRTPFTLSHGDGHNRFFLFPASRPAGHGRGRDGGMERCEGRSNATNGSWPYERQAE